jgi:hypothetical protein
MTTTPKSDRAALERLADALVEDILVTGDAELLAEVQADGEDDAKRARAAFRRAAALARLEAKGSAHRRVGYNVRALDAKAARRWLEEFIADDPEASGGLAAAARKVGKLTDEDVYGLLERLQKRSTVQDRGRDHDGR